MAAQDEPEGPRGTGEAAAGWVSAEVGADGLLEGLRLNPRLLRSSSDELAGHVVSAVRAAQQDRLGKLETAGDEETAAGVDPAELMRRLDDLEAQAALDFTRLNAALDETLRRIQES
ncbi:hypothetical protein Misp01_50920 [Microtetraspora sp. NBRC 13810]|uniref:YbaB/EbfC family nucleoid-associated protein n=1 Tax=Microtetraspora sp. NBRC 13810 TaxID=3030990 RepID=UPI00249FF2AA|nr:YbaB/EbfC family nucleoid-associated protein [Microtetraspora sp. NBRC 13810]GLW09963.1 hypothetical protein Misp01_50920 [Microtetraspora sp. NBRC 13810]